MPTSTHKTVLFCRVQVERKVHLYPVSVHVNEKSGKNFGAMIYMAYHNSDVDRVKQLDPSFPFMPDGTLPKGAKWSIKVVPYEPAFDALETDVIDMEPAQT